jgi:hypothetical protein
MILILLSLYPPLREAEEFGFGDITRLKTPSISVTYQNLFSISELQSVKVEWNNDKYGFQLLHFGTKLYREITIGGRYNLTIENIYIVLEPSLLCLSQNDKDNYGFNSNFMLGIMLRDYKIYLNAIHPISYIRGQTIPVEMELCLIYENEWNSVGFKLDYLEDWGIGLGFGYTLKFTNFKAGIGLLTNPMIPTAGFSVDVGNVCFCAGFQNHPELGLSRTFTVYYKR